MSGASLALSNLRAMTIVIVLAFHAMLPYLAFLPPGPYPFDAPPYEWQAFALVDNSRFAPFDIFCAWQDVCLMSIFFFLSGLFVWPSLRRKGSGQFLADRLWRIGVPFVLAIALLMPVAYYPSYAVTAADPSVAGYWQHLLALPFWPCGPQWFLWQLLALNIVAAAVYRLMPQTGDHLTRLASSARTHPAGFFIALLTASAVAYVPLVLVVDPWSWSLTTAFGFQLSRPLHYLVYFFAGIAVGAHGLDRGLLASDGTLARRWKIWLAAAGAAFVLWLGATSLIIDNWDASPLGFKLAAAAAFVIACATGCFAVLAVFVRFGRKRVPVFDSLSEKAYGLYLVHYVFVVWLQYALFGREIFAVIKVAIVFCLTLLLSWATITAMRGIPFGARLIGEKS